MCLRISMRALSFFTAGLLPERLRVAYGLKWDARRQALLDMLSRASRRLLPLAPAPLRSLPVARRTGLLRRVLDLGRVSPS